MTKWYALTDTGDIEYLGEFETFSAALEQVVSREQMKPAADTCSQ